MRILLDQNTPAPLRYALQGHQVETAYEKGWAELLNGDLIEAAEADGFDVLITTDAWWDIPPVKSLSHQNRYRKTAPTQPLHNR